MRKALPLLLATIVIGMPALPQTTTPEEASAKPAPPAWTKKLFYGGGFGLAFGSVESVYIAPLVGYHVVPHLDLGTQPFYLYTNNKLYTPAVKTNAYGADVFARARVFRGFFAEGRYEWIDHEYLQLDGSTARRSDSLWLLGAGYFVGTGPVGVSISALYDLTYDGNDPYRPYDNPWILQVGVGVNF